MQGKLFVVTGPSAVGKSTVVSVLLNRMPKARRLVTHTTRSPRPGEEEGRDYYFVNRREFESLRDQGFFFEWAETYGNLYGSSRKELAWLLSEHPVVVIGLDTRGARTVLETLPDARVIFLVPDSLEDLKRRLGMRGTATEAEFERRCGEIEREIARAGDFHHTVVNIDGELESTVEAILQIIGQYVP